MRGPNSGGHLLTVRWQDERLFILTLLHRKSWMQRHMQDSVFICSTLLKGLTGFVVLKAELKTMDKMQAYLLECVVKG